MNHFVIAALAALVPAGAALFILCRTLSARPSAGMPADVRLAPPSGKYRPMARLLHEDDFRYLSAQPGYSPQLGRRLRSQRRRIFRGYLRSLRRDFANISMALRTLILHSAEDRSDLAAALVRQRLLFAAGMLAVEGRLLLHAAGINTVAVDVRGLVESLETMQAQMGQLLMPAVASA
jgi:hypothetical protein